MSGLITVLVGWHDHRVSGRPVRNPGDTVAASLALTLAGADAIRLLCAGAMPDGVARDYLALGARRIEIFDMSPPGAHDIAPLLASALRDSTMVLTGTRAAGGPGSGALPYAIADRLHRPMLPDVVALQADRGAWLVTQALPKGARRRLRLNVPAVLAIHPSAPVVPRHSHRDRQAGEVLRHTVAATDLAASPWQIVPAARQLHRLRAESARSGHSRMLGAIATEHRAATGAVLKDGSADDKARAIFDYLRTHSLLSF